MFRLIKPHYRLALASELDVKRLRSLGIDGLLLDLDGTLKDYRSEIVPDAVVAWIDELKSEGIKLCLVSNGKHKRIERFAKTLGVPFVAKAFKPLPFGCKRALKLLQLEPVRVGMIGDQIFADVLAGRLAGLRTFLVPPTHPLGEEPWFTRMKRPFERWAALALLRLAS